MVKDSEERRTNIFYKVKNIKAEESMNKKMMKLKRKISILNKKVT